MQPTTAPTDSMSRRKLVEAVIASTIGTTIEWYDFFLYNFAATIVFPKLFFPQQSEFVGQILTYLTFSVGFLSRPLGGVVFGYVGDRWGRKASLMATLLLMGVSTTLIGALPTHAWIGVMAPLLLTLLRCLQGVGVGGEWGGAVLLALETGHRSRRGFYSSWPQAGVPLGLLAAGGLFTLLNLNLSEEAFLDWGWRIPFLAGVVTLAVGVVVRGRVAEPKLFTELKEKQQLSSAPIAESIRRYWREILLAAGTRLSENTCFYLFTTFVITYVHTIHRVSKLVVLGAIGLAAVVEFFTIPLYGLLSDYWSRRGAYMLGCLFLIVFALPYYYLLGTREPVWICIAVVVALNGGHALLYSVQGALIPELFGTRVRYTGASIGYQLGSPLAGGLAPTVALLLTEWMPGEFWPLGQYIILVSVISLISVWCLAETSRKDLTVDESAHG